MLGNITGFLRVALTAYLLGTHHAADSLAVAVGPLDTLNGVLANTMVFAFVPMLAARHGAERTALFLKLDRLFTWIFGLVASAVIVFAPLLIQALAPGFTAGTSTEAVWILRITALSSIAAGAAAIHTALLYTESRFAPSAFNQACLNVFTIAGALCLWRVAGVYGFAVGYTVGAWVQLGVVYGFARSGLNTRETPACPVHWRELLAKPALFLTYACLIALNVIITRAYATHAGPGMAAALDYSLRCLTVPLAYLVNPFSNSLLPEIAKLRIQRRVKEAFRLIDRTLVLAGLAAAAGCALGIAVRQPAIALMFERGSFTAQSTSLVSAVFLGLAPSLIGWSLLELNSRSLFALGLPWLPVAAAAIPVVFNLGYVFLMRTPGPQWIGLGASAGLLIGFLFLLAMMHSSRKRWLGQAECVPHMVLE